MCGCDDRWNEVCAVDCPARAAGLYLPDRAGIGAGQIIVAKRLSCERFIYRHTVDRVSKRSTIQKRRKRHRANLRDRDRVGVESCAEPRASRLEYLPCKNQRALAILALIGSLSGIPSRFTVGAVYKKREEDYFPLVGDGHTPARFVRVPPQIGHIGHLRVCKRGRPNKQQCADPFFHELLLDCY